MKSFSKHRVRRITGYQLTDKKAFDNLQSPIRKMVEPQETEGSLRLDSVATENLTCVIEFKAERLTV